MPVHVACYALAERFVEISKEREEADGGDSSRMDLWEVLSRRLPGSLPFPSAYILPEPHDYYGGKAARNVYWEWDNDPVYGKVRTVIIMSFIFLVRCGQHPLLKNYFQETSVTSKLSLTSTSIIPTDC